MLQTRSFAETIQMRSLLVAVVAAGMALMGFM